MRHCGTVVCASSVNSSNFTTCGFAVHCFDIVRGIFESSLTGLQFGVLNDNPPLSIFGRLITVIRRVTNIMRLLNSKEPVQF